MQPNGKRTDRPRGAAATDARPHAVVDFILERMPLCPVPAVPEISLHTAHPSSGLWQLLSWTGTGDELAPPYWAYPWAGGTVLARYLLDRSADVRGRRVLDLGAGSGLVGIAAAKSGAADVIACEIDPNGQAAIGLNAAANGVMMKIISEDLLGAPPPDVDMVVAGDVFYSDGMAVRVVAYLDRCVAAGISVLVGDPGRAFLPLDRLRLLAGYAVGDFGEPATEPARPSGVYAFGAAHA